jgi:2-dehydro-3-deoxygluconokinase
MYCVTVQQHLHNASKAKSTLKPLQFVAIGECMLEVQANGFGPSVLAYGGDTFNTSVYLRRCSAPDKIEVSYATGLGTDHLSQTLRQEWAKLGLNLNSVEYIEGRLPGMYLIETDSNGERTFHFWRENSAARAYFQASVTALEKNLNQFDCLYFSGISLAILDATSRTRLFALLKQAKLNGCRVVFDNNFRPKLWPDRKLAQEVYRQAFAACQTAMITLDDHQAVFDFSSLEEALVHAKSLAIPELVIKRGAEHTLVRPEKDKQWLSIPTLSVQQVIDTTAAGDAFAAAYLSRRLCGASAQKAASFGNAVAARVIQYRGALIPEEALQDLISSPVY